MERIDLDYMVMRRSTWQYDRAREGSERRECWHLAVTSRSGCLLRRLSWQLLLLVIQGGSWNTSIYCLQITASIWTCPWWFIPATRISAYPSSLPCYLHINASNYHILKIELLILEHLFDILCCINKNMQTLFFLIGEYGKIWLVEGQFGDNFLNDFGK